MRALRMFGEFVAGSLRLVVRGSRLYHAWMAVLLAMVAPRCLERRRMWISGAMIAWSVVYFRWMI